ncbi:MAG: hypothetical protein CL484_07585 [Acidobacteria bacterium]|nr:hypothetical protein [Acidobacteriota bacterium]|tara:strand:+ start:2342 stop:2980 length:639 start_codon:yes stop_codon:yes gene_type:complete
MVSDLVLALRGDLKKQLAHEERIIAEGTTRAVRGEARKLRTVYRRQVRKAKFGKGLEKAWQVVEHPSGRKYSMRASATVISKADRIHDAFTADRFIRVRNAKYIVVPTEAAKAAGYATSLRRSEGNRPKRYGDLEKALQSGRRFARVVSKKSGNILLIDRQSKQHLFTLVRPGVSLKGRFDIDGPAQAASDKLAPRIVSDIHKVEQRVMRKG